MSDSIIKRTKRTKILLHGKATNINQACGFLSSCCIFECLQINNTTGLLLYTNNSRVVIKIICRILTFTFYSSAKEKRTAKLNEREKSNTKYCSFYIAFTRDEYWIFQHLTHSISFVTEERNKEQWKL